MRIRDWLGVLAGAAFSFGIAALAYAHHPERVVLIGLVISVVLLVSLSLLEAVREPWASIEIANLRYLPDGRTLVMLAITVHGKRPLGTEIVNVLFPVDISVSWRQLNGDLHRDHRDLWAADELIGDGEPAQVWDHTFYFARGTHLFYFGVDAGQRPSYPIRFNLLTKRRDIQFDSALNARESVSLARVRPWLNGAMARLAKRVRLGR